MAKRQHNRQSEIIGERYKALGKRTAIAVAMCVPAILTAGTSWWLEALGGALSVGMLLGWLRARYVLLGCSSDYRRKVGRVALTLGLLAALCGMVIEALATSRPDIVGEVAAALGVLLVAVGCAAGWMDAARTCRRLLPGARATDRAVIMANAYACVIRRLVTEREGSAERLEAEMQLESTWREYAYHAKHWRLLRDKSERLYGITVHPLQKERCSVDPSPE